MKNKLLKTLLLLALPFVAQAQADTVFAQGMWMLPTLGGLQCTFKFDSIEIERVMFNPHKFDGVNYQYESEYQIGDGYGNFQTYPMSCSAWHSLNFENTAYSPDTIEVLGHFWVRVDAVDFKAFTKKKNRIAEISVNATPGTVNNVGCGCYKKLGRSKVVIDWIRKEPLKIDRA